MRKGPIYLLVDTSESMRGEPIESVMNGLRGLVAILRKDPQALETAYLSVITFGGIARQLVPLTELSVFELPPVQAGGSRILGAAIELLCERRCHEVVQPSADFKGDWLPMVFILTDGMPDDDISSGLSLFRSLDWGVSVSCAADPGADKALLDKITPECVVELASADSSTLLAFFKWVTARLVPDNTMMGAVSQNPAEASFARVWDGRYFKCSKCGEIFSYTLGICPFCGVPCREVAINDSPQTHSS